MSFVSVTRDYIEFLSTSNTPVNTDFQITNKFIIETLFYYLKTGFSYLVTFQWVRDFTLLPIILPQASVSILKETFFLETPSKIFFKFLERPGLDFNPFLLGFFNSIFLTLPFSVTHIIAIRRLIIHGIPAAAFWMGGYFFGQILFLTAVLFGFRPLLIPLLTCEPLTYFLGFIISLRVIYGMTLEPLKELRVWAWNRSPFKDFFITSFLLSWCEQSCFFQYLGNISLNTKSTILEGFTSTNLFSNYFIHFLYLGGISLGCVFFTCLWGFLILQVKNLCIIYTPLFVSRFIQTINKGTFILTLSLSLSSLCFYSFDYLVTNPLGFVSQDKSFKNTIFDQYNVPDFHELVGTIQSLEFDVSLFDRGRYLIFPDTPQFYSYEDFNYQGEADWTSRYDKVSTYTERAGILRVATLFQKLKKKTQKQTPPIEDLKKNKLLSEDLVWREEITPENEAEEQVLEVRFSEWYSTWDDGGDKVNYDNAFRDFSDSSFPMEFLRIQSLIEPDIEKKVKNHYYSNAVYQNFLKFEIDSLLKRQPKTFRLSGENESDLYEKRLLLTSYYDSLRDYSKLPYSETFDDFFDGSKTFANKVYNQQFKGTLRTVRRLFSVTPETEIPDLTQEIEVSHIKEEPVLKFDQPLYKFNPKDNYFGLHEELGEVTFDTPSKSVTPFISEFIIKPLYAGWDEKSRKFVITNKLLARNVAGYKVNISADKSKKFKNTGNEKEKSKPQKIKFTTWPLIIEKLFESNTQSSTSYVTLYEGKFNPENETKEVFQLFDTLPANWKTLKRVSAPMRDLTDIFDYLAPQRGGFLWPGTKKLPGSKNYLDFLKIPVRPPIQK